MFDVATSVVAYLALTAAMYAALDVSLLLVLAFAVPAAGFLVRTFIVFHDCAHGSFCRGGVRTTGWASPAGLWSIHRFTSGVTNMRCITRRPVISTGVAEGMSRR